MESSLSIRTSNEQETIIFIAFSVHTTHTENLRKWQDQQENCQQTAKNTYLDLKSSMDA